MPDLVCPYPIRASRLRRRAVVNSDAARHRRPASIPDVAPFPKMFQLSEYLTGTTEPRTHDRPYGAHLLLFKYVHKIKSRQSINEVAEVVSRSLLDRSIKYVRLAVEPGCNSRFIYERDKNPSRRQGRGYRSQLSLDRLT